MRQMILLLALFTGCCSQPRPLPLVVPPAAPSPGAGPLAQSADATPSVCRVAPNDGPPMADRGIGGTGAPAATQLADRGIGGTGIIGVITGFASICVSGHEVAFDPAMPVLIDGNPASSTDLRAGQFAVIQASGPADALRAGTIAIRHEVSGPVDRSDATGALVVAGQAVRLSAETRTDRPVAQGDWIDVSGLRAADGGIEATRIDHRVPGAVLVHGTIGRSGDVLVIGALEISVPPGVLLVPGSDVVVTGRVRAGVLYPDLTAPDRLTADPVGFFGPSVQSLVIEGYVLSGTGRLRLGRAELAYPGAPGSVFPGRGVIELTRGATGGFTPTGWHAPPRASAAPMALPGGGGRSLRGFEPAPVPNRAMGPRGDSGGGLAGQGRPGSMRPGAGGFGPNGPSDGRPPFGPRSGGIEPGGGRGP